MTPPTGTRLLFHTVNVIAFRAKHGCPVFYLNEVDVSVENTWSKQVSAILLRFPGGKKKRALTEDLILHQAWQKTPAVG